MATGYQFSTASQIATGLAVLATTHTTEYTAIQAAFNASTGHNHDGTTGGGAQIPTAGIQDLAVTTAKLAADAVTTAKITDANVTTAKIANDAVTYAKIQNVSATDKLLGRSSSGAGDVEEITCTAAGRALLDDADASAQRTTLGLGGLAILTTVGTAQIDDESVTYAKMQNVSATDKLLGRSSSGAGDVEEITCTSFARSLLDDSDAPTARNTLGIRETIIVAISDETTAITTGTAKLTFRMPYAFTLTAVRASLTTASSSGIPTFDINENGTTILSTKLTIDANEKTSTTAATAAVISDASLADDAEITVDIDVAGTGATGAKIYLIGYKTA